MLNSNKNGISDQTRSQCGRYLWICLSSRLSRVPDLLMEAWAITKMKWLRFNYDLKQWLDEKKISQRCTVTFYFIYFSDVFICSWSAEICFLKFSYLCTRNTSHQISIEQSTCLNHYTWPSVEVCNGTGVLCVPPKKYIYMWGEKKTANLLTKDCIGYVMAPYDAFTTFLHSSSVSCI